MVRPASYQMARSFPVPVRLALACVLGGAVFVPPLSPTSAGELLRYVLEPHELRDGMRVLLFGSSRFVPGVGQPVPGETQLCTEPGCIRNVPREDWLGSLVTATPGDAEGSWKLIPEGRPWVGYMSPPDPTLAWFQARLGGNLTFVSPEAAHVALRQVEAKWQPRQMYYNANAGTARRFKARGGFAIEEIRHEEVTAPHLEPLTFNRARLEVNYASPYLIFQTLGHGEVAVALKRAGSLIAPEQMARLKT